MHTEQQITHHVIDQTSSRRRNHINGIKHSLKGFALIRKNKTMIQKKLSLQSQNLSQNGSSDGFSLECQDSAIYNPYQHAEVFAEKYQILSKLGEGSDGVVHRCKKKRSGVEYAVKSFMFDDEHIPQIRGNFVLVKDLNHQNLVKYEALYLDVQKHACWLVMQLCEAPSLARLCIKSQIQFRQISQQLLETLHYLHNRAVSHRDIKAENILYDPSSKKLKLIDFGICRKNRRRGTKFQMLTITGTLYYRAPEMFTGGGYTQKVDIWSTGIMLYKLVAGHTPFQSEYHSKTINNIVSAELIFTHVFDHYSPALKHLIMRMLKKDPRERLSALDCLKDPWFYLNGTYSANNFLLSEQFNEQDMQGLKSPIGLQEGSFIRKINGQEFHCFDSDDQGTRKGVGMKRVHRSQALQIHSLTNFSL